MCSEHEMVKHLSDKIGYCIDNLALEARIEKLVKNCFKKKPLGVYNRSNSKHNTEGNIL
jgi:hypothetical protein